MFPYFVLGRYLCIFGAPSIQSCCTLSISASYHVFVYGRYRNPDLFVCGCRTWICLVLFSDSILLISSLPVSISQWKEYKLLAGRLIDRMYDYIG